MNLRVLTAGPWLALAITACGSSGSTSGPRSEADAGTDSASGDASMPVESGAAGDSAPSAEASTEAGPTPDGGGTDAANAADSGFVVGTPITAAMNQWTWVPMNDVLCANGVASGIGINPGAAGSRVLVYLEGGGACWDELTCYTTMTAAYFTTGYTQADFTAESVDATYLALPGGFFDRTAAGNPFKDYSFVYVPYCTGDVFSGDNVATFGANTAHFVGHTNVTHILERVVPTFPGIDRVVLAGSSAGGFGALHNWWQTQQAFGSVRVDLLDDSGTDMPPDIVADDAGVRSQQIAAWNLAATAPPCAACANDATAIWSFYAQAFPTHRGALLSYTMDSVLPSFDGITTAQFTTGLQELLSTQFAPNANLQSFTVGAAGHVLFFSPLLAQGAVNVQTFVTQMVTDSSSWVSVHP